MLLNRSDQVFCRVVSEYVLVDEMLSIIIASHLFPTKPNKRNKKPFLERFPA